mmetsp:Transcript_22604/g.26210  ORF Transcript_22604/g.26210 Transcript_22604/m.26210 type:complete len:93 (-) Transcript_22604:166-444(-)
MSCCNRSVWVDNALRPYAHWSKHISPIDIEDDDENDSVEGVGTKRATNKGGVAAEDEGSLPSLCNGGAAIVITATLLTLCRVRSRKLCTTVT